MIKRRRLRILFFLLKDAFYEFRKSDPLRFGASTAFFTTFALPPILVILTNLFGFLYNEEFISEQLIQKLQALFGARGATQLYTVLQNMQQVPTNWGIAIVGMLFLIFVATTLFMVVQKSLNELWHIQPKAKSKILKLFRGRAISLAIIIATGFLFIISLLSDAALTYIGNNLNYYLPNSTAYLIRVANIVIAYLFVMAWFALTFRYLPDARIPWRPVWVGAAVTALLFTIGKFVLHHLLINSRLGPIYGPSASILLIMLFVFYSSIILFYGASFTKTYANYASFKIIPKSHAKKNEIPMKDKKVDQDKNL